MLFAFSLNRLKRGFVRSFGFCYKNLAKTAYIVVKDTVNQKNITIPENEIIYAQADNIYAEVVTAQGIFLYSNKISSLVKN